MRNRPGVALLESLVAITVLAVAAVALMAAITQATSSLDQVNEAEREVRAASRLLDAAALWSRDDLDRHLGSRTQGPWRMHVERPLPQLYVVSLTDSTERRELLRTSLFRPEVRDGQR